MPTNDNIPESNFAWRLRLHATITRNHCHTADPEAKVFYLWLADHLDCLRKWADDLGATTLGEFDQRCKQRMLDLQTKAGLYDQLIPTLGRPPKPVIETIGERMMTQAAEEREKFAVYLRTEVGYGGKATLRYLTFLDRPLAIHQGDILAPKDSIVELIGEGTLCIEDDGEPVKLGPEVAMHCAKERRNGLSWLPAEHSKISGVITITDPTAVAIMTQAARDFDAEGGGL